MVCIKCKQSIDDDSVYCKYCGKKQTPTPRKALKRANGSGTVYKMSGRRRRPWVAAKNKVIIGYFEQKKEAMEALDRLAGKTLTERYNMTFAEVYDGWKEEHYREIGEKARESYENAFNIFQPLHTALFRNLRTQDFQSVLDGHMTKSYSAVSKYKHLVTQMSQWAIREEICSTNYAAFLKLPENVQKEKEIFSDEDISKLTADGSPAAKLTLMLIYTGMRIGELFSLPLSDYHGDYVIGGEKTKAGRNRVIPISAPARAYFAEMAEAADGPLLISGYNGQRSVQNFREREFYPLLSRLGISRKTPHSTRHTYASLARRAGVPPEALQKILGHADYQTTANIYVHTDILDLISAADKISVTC